MREIPPDLALHAARQITSNIRARVWRYGAGADPQKILNDLQDLEEYLLAIPDRQSDS